MSSTIALFLMDGGDYQRLLWSDCLLAAERHGFPVRAFWADNDCRKQLRQIQGCLNEPEATRPTVILVSPVREIALISMAHLAAHLGIAWVQLLRWSDYLAPLRLELPHVPIFSVMADQHA